MPGCVGPAAALAQTRCDYRPGDSPSAELFRKKLQSRVRRQMFDISEARREPQIEPCRLMNDLRRKPIAGIAALVIDKATPGCTARLERRDNARTLHPGERICIFWDYFRNAWGRDAGLRLDHLLFSPMVAKRLVAAEVDREVRSREKASDHAPVWIELSDSAQRQRPPAARKSSV
jgi:exonuclease III